ncbi:MAG: hypothetical protein ABJA82_01560 [Myxococcales bacterium]
MPIRNPRSSGRAGAYGLACAVLSLLAALAVGCTLALDTRAAQCWTNQDCAKFSGSVCDAVSRTCVPVSGVAPGSGGGGGGGGGNDTGVAGTARGGGGGAAGGAGGPRCRTAIGCAACSGGELRELLNACTDATCVPFDNRVRLMNLDADGGLRPLP